MGMGFPQSLNYLDLDACKLVLDAAISRTTLNEKSNLYTFVLDSLRVQSTNYNYEISSP